MRLTRADPYCAGHVDVVPNLRFVAADIMHGSFAATLASELCSAAPCTQAHLCVAVGMHLCGALSPRAIDLYASLEGIDALVLVPCCLDKRFDGQLKLEARQLRIDPYEAKVRQLRGLLEGCSARVRLVRDRAMRTQAGGAQTEGTDACKNAVLVGQKLTALSPLQQVLHGAPQPSRRLMACAFAPVLGWMCWLSAHAVLARLRGLASRALASRSPR